MYSGEIFFAAQENSTRKHDVSLRVLTFLIPGPFGLFEQEKRTARVSHYPDFRCGEVVA